MLKNVLIVVDDIEKSREFYRDLFGLQVILKNEGNVILSKFALRLCVIEGENMQMNDVEKFR